MRPYFMPSLSKAPLEPPMASRPIGFGEGNFQAWNESNELSQKYVEFCNSPVEIHFAPGPDPREDQKSKVCSGTSSRRWKDGSTPPDLHGPVQSLQGRSTRGQFL